MGFSSSSSSSSVKQNSGVKIGATSGNGKVILFPGAIHTGANSASSSSYSKGGDISASLGFLMNLQPGAAPAPQTMQQRLDGLRFNGAKMVKGQSLQNLYVG